MADQFLVERTLMRRGQSLTAIFAREAQAGKAAVEQPALQHPVARDDDEFRLIVLAVLADVGGLDGSEIGLDPGAGAQSKLFGAFHVRVHAACSRSI